MDDTEAKKAITDALEGRLDGEPIRVGMVVLIHALQAMDDRAALHEIYVKDPDSSWDRAEARLKVFFAVEKHMKGGD